MEACHFIFVEDVFNVRDPEGRLSSIAFSYDVSKCAFPCFDLMRSQFCIAALIA